MINFGLAHTSHAEDQLAVWTVLAHALKLLHRTFGKGDNRLLLRSLRLVEHWSPAAHYCRMRQCARRAQLEAEGRHGRENHQHCQQSPHLFALVSISEIRYGCTDVKSR